MAKEERNIASSYFSRLGLFFRAIVTQALMGGSLFSAGRSPTATSTDESLNTKEAVLKPKGTCTGKPNP